MRYVLRALDRAGNQFFYTGKAGQAWVSLNFQEAFVYSHRPTARLRQFNDNEPLHRLWFTVIELPLDRPWRDVIPHSFQ